VVTSAIAAFNQFRPIQLRDFKTFRAVWHYFARISARPRRGIREAQDLAFIAYIWVDVKWQHSLTNILEAVPEEGGI